jgi:hypothetical protein
MVDETMKNCWRYCAIAFFTTILNGCYGSIAYHGPQYELNNASLHDSIGVVTYQSKSDYAEQLCPYGIWPSLIYMSILTKNKVQAALDTFPKGGIVEILIRNRSMPANYIKLKELKIRYEHLNVAYDVYKVYESRAHYCTCSELMDTHIVIKLVDSLRDDAYIKWTFSNAVNGEKCSNRAFQSDSCEIRRMDR